MDILEKRHVEISALALDGLATRHKAITSNIANAESPDYKKVEVQFENQLRRIINTEEKKDQYMLDNMFSENRVPYTPGKFDMSYKEFNPQVMTSESGIAGRSNVNVEREMAELAKNGMRYNALATLQQKAYQGMKDLIKGGGG